MHRFREWETSYFLYVKLHAADLNQILSLHKGSEEIAFLQLFKFFNHKRYCTEISGDHPLKNGHIRFTTVPFSFRPRMKRISLCYYLKIELSILVFLTIRLVDLCIREKDGNC